MLKFNCNNKSKTTKHVNQNPLTSIGPILVISYVIKSLHQVKSTNPILLCYQMREWPNMNKTVFVVPIVKLNIIFAKLLGHSKTIMNNPQMHILPLSMIFLNSMMTRMMAKTHWFPQVEKKVTTKVVKKDLCGT